MTTNEKQLGKLDGKVALITGRNSDSSDITGTELFIDGGIAQL
jgi:hypothetical protein